VYLPAYVVEYSYRGHPFRALVNGVNGHVGSEQHYSALKAQPLEHTHAHARAHPHTYTYTH
jgi:hypothetical protein